MKQCIEYCFASRHLERRHHGPTWRTALILLMCSLLCNSLNAKELVIGQVAPFSADPQRTALQLKSGADLHFEAVNKSGGVNGNTLRLVTRERDNSPQSAVQVTRALIADLKPVALLCLMGTAPMQALVKENVLSEAGIPVVGIRTGATSLHRPVHPYLFHTRADYGAEAHKAVTYLSTVGYRRFAIFAEHSAFGDEGSSHFVAALRERSLAPVARGTYETDSTDVSGAIRQIQAGQPDAIVAVGSSNAVADFYKGYLALNKGVPVIALSTVDAGSVVKRVGAEAAHGLWIAQVVPDPRNRQAGIVREFQDIGKRLRGPGFEPTQAELEGYIAARVLVEAIKRSGTDPTPTRIRAELESMRQLDLGGLVIDFSKQDHSGSGFVDVGIIGRDGRVLH